MQDPVTLKLSADELIKMALKEDISTEDVSTNAVMKEYKKGAVQLICKQDGVICGLEVFARVFKILDENTQINFYVKDGDKVAKSQRIAVRCGGGNNHRYNLSDGVMLKDNHIGAAGGIASAVKAAKEYSSFVRKIEVEVETLEQCKEAVEAGADIIMLDNMSVENMKKAVALIGGRALTECSGNVTRENIKNIISTGVDYVSSGALTHSAPILDLSLKNLRAL